jgi:hypothetical protein
MTKCNLRRSRYSLLISVHGHSCPPLPRPVGSSACGWPLTLHRRLLPLSPGQRAWGVLSCCCCHCCRLRQHQGGSCAPLHPLLGGYLRGVCVYVQGINTGLINKHQDLGSTLDDRRKDGRRAHWIENSDVGRCARHGPAKHTWHVVVGCRCRGRRGCRSLGSSQLLQLVQLVGGVL